MDILIEILMTLFNAIFSLFKSCVNLFFSLSNLPTSKFDLLKQLIEENYLFFDDKFITGIIFIIIAIIVKILIGIISRWFNIGPSTKICFECFIYLGLVILFSSLLFWWILLFIPIVLIFISYIQG